MIIARSSRKAKQLECPQSVGPVHSVGSERLTEAQQDPTSVRGRSEEFYLQLQWPSVEQVLGLASGQDKGEAHMKDTQTHTVENERTPNQRDRVGRGGRERGEEEEEEEEGKNKAKSKKVNFFFWIVEGNELRKQRDREGKKKKKRKEKGVQGPIPWLFNIRCARP